MNGKNMIVPLAGKEFLGRHELDPTGVTIGLNKDYFLPTPELPTPQGEQILTPPNFS